MSNLNVEQRRVSVTQLAIMIAVAVILSAIITSWIILSGIFATEFKPVELNAHELVDLDVKLNQLGVDTEFSKHVHRPG